MRAPDVRILFCSDTPPDQMPTFVACDWDTLSTAADISWHAADPNPRWRRGLGPSGVLPTSDLRRAARRADLVFQWFATPSAPMIAARVAHTPAIVIAGGYDVAYEPDIGYGQMVDVRTRAMVKLALRVADRVLTVSKFNELETRHWQPRARTTLIPHGFDPTEFRPRVDARVRRVVTVGEVRTDYLLRKGLLDFARASRAMPDVPFVLVGRHVNPDAVQRLRREGGPNLELHGRASPEELRSILGESAVYLQLSRHEAFGCAVAEAMLSGCTPVLARAGALPEVASDAAYYVDSRNPADVVASINKALLAPLTSAARDRISAAFPLESRQQRLLEIIRTVVGN